MKLKLRKQCILSWALGTGERAELRWPCQVPGFTVSSGHSRNSEVQAAEQIYYLG